MTAMDLLTDNPRHRRAFSATAIAESILQCGHYIFGLFGESVRRVDHQQAAAVEPRRNDWRTPAKLCREEIAHRRTMLDRIPGCEDAGWEAGIAAPKAGDQPHKLIRCLIWRID